MDYNEDPQGRCEFGGDCLMCVRLNCSWTGAFFRPCKAGVKDMEEVPARVIQDEGDCPHHIWDDGRQSEKSDGIWLGFKITLCCVVLALLIAFFIRCLLRKVLKGKYTSSSTELQILGLSTNTVNQA